MRQSSDAPEPAAPDAAEAPPPPVAAVLASAGLRYVLDHEPGLRRRGRAPRFQYLDAAGKRVTDVETLGRIRRLAIPPAWTDVWICADEQGHLQATGRDVRGRKQYRYHEDWRAKRDENKFHRLAAFARSLPAIRKGVDRDLALPGLPREKVLAAMVAVLDRTFVRVGDERYRRENGSYGLTTLRNRHVQVAGDRIRIRFRGKAGKEHDLTLEDKRLARIVRRCLDLPGYELFQYVEGGEPRPVCATDVNEYLKSLAGTEYTAKDFRTWGATMIAVNRLDTAERPASATAAARVVNEALRTAAGVLGNTLAVCRKSYVHPGVVSAFLEGTLKPRRSRLPVVGLRANERRTLGVLLALERAARAKVRADTAARRVRTRRTMRGLRVPDAFIAATPKGASPKAAPDVAARAAR